MFIVKTFIDTVIDSNFDYEGKTVLKVEHEKPQIREFKAWEELALYVSAFGEFSCKKGQPETNNFLMATMCTEKDALRHMCTNEYEVRRRLRLWNCKCGSFLCGYFVTDETGKVWDLRNYKRELMAVDIDSIRESQRAEHLRAASEKYEIREAHWERQKELREGKSYFPYYRNFRFIREKRQAANPEHQPFIRGRRSFAQIRDNWDRENTACLEKNWKARDKKARKSYEVNIHKHKETMQPPSKWDEELFEMIKEFSA